LPVRENNVVLVVDDEPDFLELIEMIGEGVGCEILTAATPAAFREHLSRRRPALILLDLQMPGMDGVEALRYLARHGCNAGILLASGMDQRVLVSARQLGESVGLKMLGTLQKPAMLEDIEALLRQHLSSQPSGITAHDIARGLREGEFTVHYQPKLVRRGMEWHVGAVEALVRWQHPSLGLLMPQEFLELADRHGAMAGISDAVLTAAVRQIGQWRQAGLDLALTVNLSPRLVQDLEFPDRLSRLMLEFGLPPHYLTLEVTEAAPLNNPQLVMDIFARLRLRGVGLSLDDFGTGMSSLTQLYRMPFSEVKIDSSITAGVTSSPAAVTVARALIDLAHNLSLTVCAEGVESLEAFQLLDGAGCDALQGQFVCAPCDAAATEDFIRQWEGVQHPTQAAYRGARSRIG
jgi:EAL domain-containing protein (putative c-di-GMP-specific phosphodiesterase class I)/CheY-like chemotaxis protein